MLQLGKDDEAYNFIKFWLKNTPKEQGKLFEILSAMKPLWMNVNHKINYEMFFC